MARLVKKGWATWTEMIHPGVMTRPRVLDLNDWLDAFEEAEEDAARAAREQRDQQRTPRPAAPSSRRPTPARVPPRRPGR